MTGGSHISSSGTLPEDSTRPGVELLLPMAAATGGAGVRGRGPEGGGGRGRGEWVRRWWKDTSSGEKERTDTYSQAHRPAQAPRPLAHNIH